jgi:glucans biosynthesis protein C
VLLHGQPDWIARSRACAPWLVAGSVVFYAAFLWRLSIELKSGVHATASWPVAALGAYLSVWITLLCLVTGQRLLNFDSPTMRYLAQGAYWTYLLHLPLLFALQFLLMDSELAWPLKFAISSGGTLAICLISYQVLVRHTPLRRFVG